LRLLSPSDARFAVTPEIKMKKPFRLLLMFLCLSCALPVSVFIYPRRRGGYANGFARVLSASGISALRGLLKNLQWQTGILRAACGRDRFVFLRLLFKGGIRGFGGGYAGGGGKR
jgi:hypothetical protein